MSQYRIVKMKNCEHSHKVEQKILGFWFNTIWQWQTLNDCERYIDSIRDREKIIKDNPRDIVVKTY